MIRILFLRLFFFCLVSFLGKIPVSAQGPELVKRFSYSQPKMGSPFHLILYAGDSARANHLAADCFRLVDSLVGILSDYIDSSELNRLCARAGTCEPFIASPVLYEILLASQRGFEISGGCFDISLGPLTRMWRKARKEKIFPAPSLVAEKKNLCGLDKMRIDTLTHGVTLLQKGMQLDLGGIGQGFIGQKVVDFLRAAGIQVALVDVSGDIVALGNPPGKKGWSIGINVPQQEVALLNRHLQIRDEAVTTSGDVYQYFEHEGKRYSHIVDPKTGYGITVPKNVTVIAADGTTADWLTKACSILPEKKATRLAHSIGAEVLIAELKKNKIKFYSSRGFKKYWEEKSVAP